MKLYLGLFFLATGLFGTAVTPTCPYLLYFGFTPEQVVNEYQRLVECGKIVGRGQRRLPAKNQEEFLTQLLIPLAGLDLIKTDVDEDSCRSYRAIRYQGERVFFEGYGSPQRNLVLEWLPNQKEPEVVQTPGYNKLVLPAQTVLSTHWVAAWAKKLMPTLFEKNRMSEAVLKKLQGDESDKIMALLPFGQTAYTRKVTPTVSLSETLEGALPFLKWKAGSEILHPVHGKIEVVSTNENEGGTLLAKIYSTDETVTKLTAQGQVVAATLETPAADELSWQRAQTFAPSAHVALLFLVDYLRYIESDQKLYFETLSQKFSKSIEKDLTLDAWIQSVKNQLITYGLKAEESPRLQLPLHTAHQFLTDVYHQLGADLIKDSLLYWARTEFRSQWPTLGISTHVPMGEKSPLLKQVQFQKGDILEAFLFRLIQFGHLVFEDQPQVPVVNPQHQVNGLFAFYTRSHPLHSKDFLTKELVKMRNSILVDTSRQPRDCFHYARTIISAIKPELDRTGMLAPNSFDVLSYVIGSQTIYNRAYYLSEELADVYGIDLEKKLALFQLNPNWKPQEQKTQNGVVARIYNAARKFQLVNRHWVVGKRILLIEDTNTSGITVEECRRLLLEAGAKSVKVLAFAQTIRSGQTSPFGEPLSWKKGMQRIESTDWDRSRGGREWVDTFAAAVKSAKAAKRVLEMLRHPFLLEEFRNAQSSWAPLQEALDFNGEDIIEKAWSWVLKIGDSEFVLSSVDRLLLNLKNNTYDLSSRTAVLKILKNLLRPKNAQLASDSKAKVVGALDLEVPPEFNRWMSEVLVETPLDNPLHRAKLLELLFTPIDRSEFHINVLALLMRERLSPDEKKALKEKMVEAYAFQPQMVQAAILKAFAAPTYFYSKVEPLIFSALASGKQWLVFGAIYLLEERQKIKPWASTTRPKIYKALQTVVRTSLDTSFRTRSWQALVNLEMPALDLIKFAIEELETAVGLDYKLWLKTYLRKLPLPTHPPLERLLRD